MLYKHIFFTKKKLFNILNILKKSLNNVGIKNIYYPIIFDNNLGKLQKTVGLWNFSIFLLNFKRGVHMSRFINILNIISKKPLNIKYFHEIGNLIIKKLESNSMYIQVSFIYFLKKKSPISGYKSLLNYKITLLYKKKDIINIFVLKLKIPVNSLCPCSKIISNYNAHNQRSIILIILKISYKININELIRLIENESSSELWSFIKRSDEKFITEFSYKNPKFIEDLIRNLFFKLKKNKFIYSIIIKIENFESIHNHNAYSILK